MKYFILSFLSIFLTIWNTKCEKKILKGKECSYSDKIVRLERCEVVDGQCFLKFEVLKPIEQCMVELCFYKSENTKFRLLGRCQHIDRCEMFKPAYANNPFTKSIVAFWKRSGISAASGPCPLQGVQNYENITMNENFLVFLPKGILLFTFKLYNDEFDNIIKMGMIIINN
ncbi:hypothetical protein ACKWTF_014295 [Chironomus riparius]